MSFEEVSQPENSREHISALFKERGIDDAEARDLLTQWTISKEAEVEKVGTREAQIDFEIERAQLYKDAGFDLIAFQTLEDALIIAEHEELKEYVLKINSLMDEVT